MKSYSFGKFILINNFKKSKNIKTFYNLGGYVASTCEGGLQRENIGNGYVDRNKNETYNFELDIVSNEVKRRKT
jgi:hypothetical protein